MPTTYNNFIDKQEEFWETVGQHFEDSEIFEFRQFLIPLFYLPELVPIQDCSHPLAMYGADRATSENMDQLRMKITDEFHSCPGDLLQYMFEEEDHAVYLALVAMLDTYKNLGNTLRAL
jgi:hypothetical protein